MDCPVHGWEPWVTLCFTSPGEAHHSQVNWQPSFAPFQFCFQIERTVWDPLGFRRRGESKLSPSPKTEEGGGPADLPTCKQILRLLLVSCQQSPFWPTPEWEIKAASLAPGFLFFFPFFDPACPNRIWTPSKHLGRLRESALECCFSRQGFLAEIYYGEGRGEKASAY